jgi:predicted nucleic acid-binding protein
MMFVLDTNVVSELRKVRLGEADTKTNYFITTKKSH